MKKQRIIKTVISLLMIAVLASLAVSATIPLGQSSDSGWGCSMSSSIGRGISSATMSGSPSEEIFVSVSCTVYYNSGSYESDNESIVYPVEASYCFAQVENIKSNYKKTRGMNLFQPYDDDGIDYCGTFLETTN